MIKNRQTQVLIIGAGPVGLTLAIDLAARGIEVLVIEQRRAREAPSVKCNHVSARSMEIFRRLGVAGELRNAGLPADYANDCSFRTTMIGREFSRIPIPCRRDRYSATQGPDTGWPTPEPPHRINQIYLEPILFDFARSRAKITMLNRTRIERVEQNPDTAMAIATDLDSGKTINIACQFMIGCDGGKSMVRRNIGARFVGDAVVQRVQSSYIRAPRLIDLMTAQPAWASVCLNRRRSGTIYAIDGRETWLVHNYLREDEMDFDAVDRDWAIRTILGVNDAFEYQIITREDWIGRRLVADRFRRRRVFLCGDAAHIWVPYAGYGMNAGIADAANLAWLLGAYLNGWAPCAILDAYERERLPITEQVSRFAMDHARKMIRNRREVPELIEDPGPEADAVRAEYGRAMYDLNVEQYCCAGLNFGYFYDDSPLIVYDGEKAPAYTMGGFTPSTVPGCRTPHIWLDDGRSLYDAMGGGFALLCLESGALKDARKLAEAAGQRGVPLKVLLLAGTKAAGVYGNYAYVLSRPDQHIAWRDRSLPANPGALIDKVRGAA